MRTCIRFAALLLVLTGCSNDVKVEWPEIHPAKGVVRSGGKPVTGGSLQCRSEEPALADFHITADVAADGTFNLTTGNARDRKNERRAGAPAGKFRVTYFAPQGDQTAGRPTLPVELPQPVTIAAGANELVIDLSKK